MDSNDRVWILISRSLSGEITVDEQQELNAHLQDRLDLNQQYSMLKKLWTKGFNPQDIVDQEVSEKALFKKIIDRAEVERQKATEPVESKPLIRRIFSKRFIFAYAASITLALVFFLPKHADQTGVQSEQVISAQNGSRSKILLPDGTTVWLNGGSKLYYDYEFAGPLREVRLVGEAFFDVAQMKGRPFIVHTGKIDIKVHGTAFNVKYYQDDTKIETTLLHGKIEVTDHTNALTKSIFLSPSQKLIIPVKEASIISNAKKVNPYEVVKLDKRIKERDLVETAWIYNRIEFRGEKFDELAKKLERWYNVEVKFEDESVKALTFNGSFERETVEQAFGALQRVGTFKFKIEGREIFIKSAEKNAPGMK